MQILIVDDDAAKSEAITGIFDQDDQEVVRNLINTVRTLGDAVRLMSIMEFDLVILDLMLPYISGGVPNSQAGLELLRQLRSKDGPNKSTMVIGLSAFPEEISSSREQFDHLGVLCIRFDEGGSWIGTLKRITQDVKARVDTDIRLDFIVICALEEEREAFSSTRFVKISDAVVGVLNVQYVKLPGTPEHLGAIVRLSQMGLVTATFETGEALRWFRTKLLCMSGICAGFSGETSLGQLVIASPAWEYQAGKWSENGFQIAPSQILLNPVTRAVIDHDINQDEFVEHIERGIGSRHTRPSRQVTPIIAPFGTGSAVIADINKLAHIEQQHRKIAAIDMETYGVYYVAHQFSSSVEHYFSIKCVVDFADASKGDDLHPYGCVASARATERLISSILSR